MFKRLKMEIFFISRLFRDNLVSYFFPYFKNRFFGPYLLGKISRIEYLADDRIELHCLCQKSDLWMLTCSLGSFLYYSGLRPSIIIHDDGSIDDESAKILESKFSALKILRKKQADELINNFFGITKKVISYRNGHIMTMQLSDIFLLSNAPIVMLMDSDVLFFKKPQEIVNFVNRINDLDALVSKHYGGYDLRVNVDYYNKYELKAKEAEFMNPGFIIYKKSKLSLERFLEFFEQTERKPDDYFLAMSGWGCLIAQTNYRFLPSDSYIMKGRPNNNTVMKHFTNPRRHELYAYGIDMIKKEH